MYTHYTYTIVHNHAYVYTNIPRVYSHKQMHKEIDVNANVHLPTRNENYRKAGNFGGKIVWRIAENMLNGGIYFGS